MAEVIPFPEMTPDEALDRMREVCRVSGNILLSAQPRKQMAKRRSSWPQLMEVIRHGQPVEGPWRDLLGEWFCRLNGRAVGRNVDMEVMMFRTRRRLVITAVRV